MENTVDIKKIRSLLRSPAEIADRISAAERDDRISSTLSEQERVRVQAEIDVLTWVIKK